MEDVATMNSTQNEDDERIIAEVVRGDWRAEVERSLSTDACWVKAHTHPVIQRIKTLQDIVADLKERQDLYSLLACWDRICLRLAPMTYLPDPSLIQGSKVILVPLMEILPATYLHQTTPAFIIDQENVSPEAIVALFAAVKDLQKNYERALQVHYRAWLADPERTPFRFETMYRAPQLKVDCRPSAGIEHVKGPNVFVASIGMDIRFSCSHPLPGGTVPAMPLS